MKNYLSLILFFCLSYLHLFADTYVWEDYDDFSGSSLDTSKWDVGYFSGGETVTIVNGQAQLNGAAYSSNSPTQVPSDIAAVASESTEGNTFLFFKEAGIYGIQADISLPTSNNDYDVGVYLASLDISPLASLGAELRYKTTGPVLLFDYLSSGNELEHQEAGSMDTFHQLQISKIDGKTNYYLNGYLIKQFESSSHDEDYWVIGAFNDNGFAYTTYADNVRVLRRATTTSLDGSTYSLSSSDGVSETLVFANGTFTSTFTDPEEEEIVTTDQSYILDQVSENEFRIILGDGDTMEFYTATNSGKLTDYDSSGQIDTSGTWDFTFETISTSSQSYAPSSIAGRMITYIGNGETETASFSTDGIVTDGEDWTYYEYEKTSDNVGVVTYTFANEANPAPEVETLTFTSSSGGTYDWIEYSDSTKSTPIDQGSGQFTISNLSAQPDPVTVVSDPSGLPVVVQVGEDYQWNDTLNGVTLWGVGYDNEELNTFTFSYSASVVEGVLGLVEQVTNPLVTQAYSITEEGYLEHTESSGPQYFKVHSVEDGKIVTTPFQDKSEASSSSDPHDTFFTTRAAAQEFYNSKINYAPESLDGLSVRIHDLEMSPGSEDYGEDSKYFVSQEVYSWEENKLESTTFSYVKNSASSATLTIHHDDGATQTNYDLTFSSENTATGTWTEDEGVVTYSGTTTFTIIEGQYAPDSLVGWKLDAGASTYKFSGDSSGVFYHVDEGNYSNSELSNITYTWEKAGPGIGKLHTSLDEITWMFFEDNTTGLYDWEEQEHDNGGSGNFSLNYYPDGHAHESMTGNSLMLGNITYVFTSDTSVTVSEGSTSSVLEYAYLKNGSNNGILSLDPENRYAIMDLTFYSSGYGRVDRGGSGYFEVLANWATKGWVWQDHYPWAYSNNMEDWYYQVLFINDDNESDMAHYQVWDNQWNIPGELHYSGESNFSSADAYSWEDYDDFNGTELNSSKWDVAWWDGGTAPSIDQLNNRVEFTNGSTYEANLSDLMNIPNPNAEGEYGRGYSSTSGNAPSSLADLVVFVAETVVYSNGSTEYYGEDEIYFSKTHRSRWDWDENKTVTDPYTYTKTGSDTATLTINKSGATYTAQLTFISPTEGTGNWTDYENGQTETGTLTFKIEYSPHSLLEFVQSDDIKGIEFELMIPDGAPDQTCIGLFAVDYNAMFNATSDEQEEQAMRFDLDLCYFGGTLTSEFNFKDQTTGQEISEKRSSTLGNFQKFQFYFADGKIYFSLPGQEAKEYNFDRGNETFVIRAQNEQNLDFSTYLRNVRVLRKKSYPQGWMWMDYYPWVYSEESNSWLYFQLAKDTDGQPGMIYWDTATKDWDIYQPTLSPEQAEDRENATKLLNQE